MSVKLNELLPGQRELLKRDDKIVVWTGGIRAGKGVGAANRMVYCILHNLIHDNGCHRYIMAGQSVGSFVNNNEGYVADIAEQAGLVFSTHKNDYLLTLGNRSAIINVYGGGNARSYHALRGLTAHSAWIDEATLCDQQFITTAIERCSYGDSQVILTTNADRPNHWIKTDFLDAGKAYAMTSTFEENIHYSEERREELKALNPHTSNYKRAIQNIWAGDEGLVYIIPKTVNEKAPLVGKCVIDPGTASVCAALLVNDSGLIVDEYYHQGDKFGRLTDRQHIDKIRKTWQVTEWIVDPAGANMRAELAKLGFSTRAAKNDWEEGVQITNNALHADKLRVHERCTSLISEASSLAWNPSLNTPKPGPDHAVDCMRYAAMRLYPAYRSQLIMHS